MSTQLTPKPAAGTAKQSMSSAEETFELWRMRSGIVLAPLAFGITYLLCGTLTPEGRTMSAILAAVGMMWVTEVIPLPVSALLGAAMCVVLGVGDAKTVLAAFGDPIVFVFVGSFMLARAMTVHGLDRRIALGFLSLPGIGNNPVRIMAGIGFVSAALSMWVSNTATTAMMLPIALGLIRSLPPQGASYGTGMMLLVAYGASVGGIATPVGSPPNLITIGHIRNAMGIDISFFRWMTITVPVLLLMGTVLFLLMIWLHPPKPQQESADDDGADDESESNNAIATTDSEGSPKAQPLAPLGPWTQGEINTVIAFALAVTLWITPGILQLPWFEGSSAGAWMKERLPESVVALLAAILLFMLPTDRKKGEFTLTWSEAVKIDWGTILLFGGGLVLGTLMIDTGVAKSMGEGLTAYLGVKSLWMLTGLSIAMAIVLSEAASNTAATNMIIPVVIAIATAAGISPLPPALGACLGASFGFMLPISTPPNAIAYGSGLVSLPSMVRAGFLFDILGFFVIWGSLWVLCPVLGLM